jgi:hypothetical protein
MGMHVCMGAMMQCSFGAAPSSLIVLPVSMVVTSSVPAATIMDHIPVANIPPFGMCQAPSNPQVIALTAAALGVFTPAPCIPVTPAPWVVGAPTVMVANKPALNNSAKLMCTWAGVIQFTAPGQFTEQVP